MSFATIVFQRNALVVLGDVAQRPVGGGAQRSRTARSLSAGQRARRLVAGLACRAGRSRSPTRG